MHGTWTILNDLRVRRYADGRQEHNSAEVPLWEKWEVRETAKGLEAEQVAVADAREGPWRDERIGPFRMSMSGNLTEKMCGTFIIKSGDGTLILTGKSDGAVLSGTAKTFRADHVKIEQFSGSRDAERR